MHINMPTNITSVETLQMHGLCKSVVNRISDIFMIKFG